MGGTVPTGQQNTNQNTTQLQNTQGTSTTSPYGPAAPLIGGFLTQAGGINPALTGTESYALDQLAGTGLQGNQFTSGIGNAANNLLAGGGALNQAPMINQAYQNYQQQLNPYLQQSFLDPMNNPGFGTALSTLNSDISNQVNSQFAGAGRDLSGLNTQTLARGLSQGEGGLIANQYNQNVANQLGAMGASYGAGNTTGGLLSQLQQNYNANQQAGIQAAQAAWQAQQSGPLLALQAEAQRRGIPLQTLAAQMGVTLPAAQAFGTTASTNQGYGTGQNVGQTTMSTPLWQNLLGGAIGGAGLLGGLNKAGLLPFSSS